MTGAPDAFAMLLAAAGEAARLPFVLLIVFGCAKLLAELFERMHQPGIIGEILAGVLIGPSVLNWIQPTDFLAALAQLGVMFLLFRVGLDIKASKLMAVGGTAAVVAILGVVAPFFLGWGILKLWGEPHLEAIFTGAAMVATSVGITAQVLRTKDLLSARASQIILGAAVIDDVLGLLVLAAVSSLAKGSINIPGLVTTAVAAIAFTALVAFWGTRTVNRVAPIVDSRLRIAEASFALAMCLLFALSAIAVYAGVAAIVGAFLAGMAMSESASPRVRDLAHGVTELLVPFFMAGIGLHLDVAVFSNRSTLALSLIILAAAIVSKLFGCGLGAIRLGRADALRVGIGMIPRGEVGLVVAGIGQSMGVIAPSVYAVVVFMAVATTIVAPPFLPLVFRGIAPAKGEEEQEAFRLG